MDVIVTKKNTDAVEISKEQVNWNSRKVRYLTGTWEQIQHYIPKFKIAPFESKNSAIANPFLRQIVRIPMNKFESEIPVGAVSPKYTLAQHHTIAEICVTALKDNGFDINVLECELGLSELDEWMNFRIIFPKNYEIDPGDGHKLNLRLECFNSVDGSSRLQVRIIWNRLVCLNGISIGETKSVSNIHNAYMDLSDLTKAINVIIHDIERQKKLFRQWTKIDIKNYYFEDWINQTIAPSSWGIKAACRIYHICNSGFDVELTQAFEKGLASKKTVRKLKAVPGSPPIAKSYYDVVQALSWVATQRKDAETRSKWQADISKLMVELESYAYYPETR